MISAPLLAAIGFLAAPLPPSAPPQDGPCYSAEVARVERAFENHLQTLAAIRPLDAAAARQALAAHGTPPLERAIALSESVALLDDTYRSALSAWEFGDAERGAGLAYDRVDADDPFVAAHAAYLTARALERQGRVEEALAVLRSGLESGSIAEHTGLAPLAWFLRGACEARTLQTQDALASLTQATRCDDAPEMVRVASEQLRLELERREAGSLDEIAAMMDYVGDRLENSDVAEPVRSRQDQIIAMLDQLIEEQKQQESQCSGGGQDSAGGQGQQPRDGSGPGRAEQPRGGRDESIAPPGVGEVGELHAAAEARAGEMWGKLPPSERERILQAIRERFPSRYRPLVEQYYRSLAEEE